MERKKNWTYHLSRPGADHHARWMSKAIYILKLSLIGHQLTQSPLSWQKKEKIRLLAPWIVFCYMQYWFLAPSLEDAFQDGIFNIGLHAAWGGRCFD